VLVLFPEWDTMDLKSYPEELGHMKSMKKVVTSTEQQSLPLKSDLLRSWYGSLQVWLPELRSFPEELGEMANVEQMVISGKELRKLPSSLGSMQKLRFLILGGPARASGAARFLPAAGGPHGAAHQGVPPLSRWTCSASPACASPPSPRTASAP